MGRSAKVGAPVPDRLSQETAARPPSMMSAAGAGTLCAAGEFITRRRCGGRALLAVYLGPRGRAAQRAPADLRGERARTGGKDVVHGRSMVGLITSRPSPRRAAGPRAWHPRRSRAARRPRELRLELEGPGLPAESGRWRQSAETVMDVACVPAQRELSWTMDSASNKPKPRGLHRLPSWRFNGRRGSTWLRGSERAATPSVSVGLSILPRAREFRTRWFRAMARTAGAEQGGGLAPRACGSDGTMGRSEVTIGRMFRPGPYSPVSELFHERWCLPLSRVADDYSC